MKNSATANGTGPSPEDGRAPGLGPAPALDETDLALVNALQAAPRASWTLVGQALGISAVTAARRWERLRSRGLAWVTAYGGPVVQDTTCTAYVEVDCLPSHLRAVTARLVRDPHIAGVEHVSGGTDLLLTVMAADLTALSRLVVDVVGAQEGVTSVRSMIATHLFTEGSRWDLRSLDPRQRGMLRPAGGEASAAGTAVLAPEDRPLLIALGRDGRLGYGDLAEATGMSESTVRRRVTRMLANGTAIPRCEIAQSVSGFPTFVHYLATVPSAELGRVASSISAVAEVRMCAAIAARHALLIIAWVRSIPDTLRLEAQMAERFPELVIEDRRLTLANPKRMGHLLDAEGRSVDFVPMDVWS
ncbi:Lrp/AsnC family transcriptional regulator [Yinghuangia seranimata]|uniref:Lrp/AsnC family transcriptional regulator n=1 Tax=Yinghuangia seranimata TaxID=408067 RepID=UPI00248B162B|nr:Lrp/AsnC family transcriptional regulator [Yinghuangia seranimata]MDI2128452.1 Lrp/AsnC family transcriptional regulator [Yinghuangia seranimata]